MLPELADQPFPGQLNQVMETGEVISVKESIVTFIEPGGSKRITYVDYSYQPLTDANGQRNRVLVMSQISIESLRQISIESGAY